MASRLRLAAVTLLASAVVRSVEGQVPPAPAGPARLSEVNLGTLPWTTQHGGWRVVVRQPTPDIRARGGSGGSMFEVEVARPPRTSSMFVVMAIGMAVTGLANGRPSIEVWSAAGGGTYTRAVYRWLPDLGRFCATRVDEFEDYGDEQPGAGRFTIAGSTRLVRYARSRRFGCEPLER